MPLDRPKASMLTVGEDFDLDGDTPASQDGPEAEGQEQSLAPGTQAGRYLILDQLGRGGMGVVYKAYDPELDRRIALKLLSVKKASQTQADRARDRLLREAKALAQLSHPNVVAAFDVGTLDQDVFVAMELVEGKTLKEWVEDQQPSIWDRVQVLTAAGRGIDAAHRAGLIHRDIKPDNIIVGDDGRVRVLDFGLARAALTEEPEKPENPQPMPILSGDLNSAGSFLSTPMTQAGAIVGTPGYMAPEQYLGGAVDEQSDQYSFCVTLYEMLFGVRPFLASRYGALKEKVLTGRLDPPPADAKVPARYRRIALRGLAVAREDRFASMGELLTELAKDPRVARRRGLTIAAVLLLLVASFAGAYALQAQKLQLCAGAQAKTAAVWGPQQKQQVEKSFGDSGRPYAADTFARVDKLLDQRAQAWVIMRTEACEATHVRGEQSAALMDKRMACLDRRLSELRALAELFAESKSTKVVDQAVQAAHSLRPLAPCADAEFLLAAVAPPEDPAIGIKVEALRKSLDQVEALKKTGQYRQGLAPAVEVARQSMALDYPPIQALALAMQAGLLLSLHDYRTAEPVLEKTILAAATVADDVLLARSWIDMMAVLTGQRRLKEAQALRTTAKAAVLRAGSASSLQVGLLRNLGKIYYQQAEYDKCEPLIKEAIARQEKSLGPSHPRLAAVLSDLGNQYFMQGKYEKALAQYQRTLVIRQKALSPGHPAIAAAVHNVGIVRQIRGEYDQAQAAYLESIRIWDLALGPDNSESGHALRHLGMLAQLQNDLDASMRYLLRALAIFEKVYGQVHQDTANLYASIARTYGMSGKHLLADKNYRSALAILEKMDEPNPLTIATVLTGLGECLIDQKKASQALEPLARALSLHEAKTGDPNYLAKTRFELARALWRTRRNRPRALRLAKMARQTFLATGEIVQSDLEEVQQWLTKRDPA